MIDDALMVLAPWSALCSAFVRGEVTYYPDGGCRGGTGW